MKLCCYLCTSRTPFATIVSLSLYNHGVDNAQIHQSKLLSLPMMGSCRIQTTAIDQRNVERCYEALVLNAIEDVNN